VSNQRAGPVHRFAVDVSSLEGLLCTGVSTLLRVT
jgi:hypothetical protein